MNHVARTSKIVGGMFSLSALALGGSQFYRSSSARLGPGAFLLSIPKLLCAALAPFLAAAGAIGAACGLSAAWMERGTQPTATKRPGPGAPLVVVAGLSAAAVNAMYTRRMVTAEGEFSAAFGTEWRERIPARAQGAMLARRWTWKVPVASGARVVRDVAFATVPGTHRRLLADLWSPPDGVPPSGLGFIYTHGGGYTAFDKGGPTEPWFRHLAAQGHVVMDVSYRLIPETNVPGMQGDVKRAVAWLKRNADQYGVDPRHIVLGGGSGGSHLALLAAYTPDHPLLTPEDLHGMDLSVRGVIGYYSAGDYRPGSEVVVNRTAVERRVAGLLTRLLERFSGSELAVDETGDWAPQVLLGGQPEDWSELYRRVSPITHVGPNTPPTLQFVGEHDVYLSRHRREVALHRKLQEARVPSVYVEFPRTDHAFDMFLPTLAPAAQAAMYDVDRFLGLLASPHDWKATAPTTGSPADDE